MKPVKPALSLLAIAAGSLVAFLAAAQSGDRAAKERELQAARAQLQESARRVAELSRELGQPGEAVVVERRLLGKPVLGVLLEPDEARGVRISGITPDSGAAKAGLRAGDRIVSVDGVAVAGSTGADRLQRLREALDGLKDGVPVRVGYERDGRGATASVTPAMASSIAMFDLRGDGPTGPDGVGIGGRRIEIHRAPGAPGNAAHDADGRTVRRVMLHPGAAPHAAEGARAPDVRREVIHLARDPACRDGKDCHAVALTEALRWNGLNLASVDAQLGRYFGASDGVLVVSAGPQLEGLQSGDVIRAVDGRRVATPRDVMDALRDRPEGSTVPVEVLRDRRTVTAQLRAPKAMRIPLPPAPPAPPAPAAPAGTAAPPAPPAPTAPPAGMAGLAVAPAAPAAPPAPPTPPPPARVD